MPVLAKQISFLVFFSADLFVLRTRCPIAGLAFRHQIIDTNSFSTLILVLGSSREGASEIMMRLPPLPSVGDIIRLYNLSANQKLAQNFLLNMNVTGTISDHLLLIVFRSGCQGCW